MRRDLFIIITSLTILTAFLAKDFFTIYTKETSFSLVPFLRYLIAFLIFTVLLILFFH